jgi:hypothetical protein
MPSRFKRLFKGLPFIAIAGAVVILGAVGCWIYPDVSSLRAICEPGANSVYLAHVVHAIVAAEDPQFLENSHRRYTGASTLADQLVRTRSANHLVDQANALLVKLGSYLENQLKV